MSDSPAEVKAKPKKGIAFIVVPILCIAGVIFLKLSFIFFVIGMLPSLVARMIDKGKHKYVFSTVTALNFAGVFPYMMDITMHGGSFEFVNTQLGDVMVWFVMYGSAGLGWLLVYISPIIASAALKAIYAGRIAHMERIQQKLTEEWGEEVAQPLKG